MDTINRCTKCGGRLIGGEKFCSSCGTSVYLMQNDVPTFTAPKQQNDVPTFTAPKQQSDAPTFTAPKQQNGAPTFTAPKQQNDAPTFTAPGQQSDAPTFTAPGGRSSNNSSPRMRYHSVGECCAYHPHNRAITQCNNCGRPICESCRDAGELTNGLHVCYDCASAIVQADVDIAKGKRSKIVLQIFLGVIGAIVFGIISSTSGFCQVFGNNSSQPIVVWQVLFTLFGAALSIYFPILKRILKFLWKVIRWNPRARRNNIILDFVVSFIKFSGAIMIFVGFAMAFSIFMTFSPAVALVLLIVDLIRYARANKLVKRNQEIMQHLADRMEYIRIQSEENADADTLANDQRMQNNQFAQAVRREGYANASKTFADEAQEMAENDRKIKKFIFNEYGEMVRAA